MAKCVAGELYHDLDGQLSEIKRQLRQPNGYPYDPYALKNALQCIIEGKFDNTAGKSDLLRWLTTSTVHGKKNFCAKDYFIVDTSGNAVVKISFMSDNFRKLFLGKVEENVENVTLNIYNLEKALSDAFIRAELGERAETSIGHLWALLAKQPNGESGVLLINGYANIFYIRGSNDKLLTVDAHWYDDNWILYVYLVENPDEWRVGSRVVSR